MFSKIVKFVFSIATISILVACGGGGSSNNSENTTTNIEKISSRDVVTINYNYSPEICKSSDFKRYIMDILSNLKPKDFIASVQSNSVTCKTYGKINNGNECYESHLSDENYRTSCVVALNSPIFKRNNKLLKMSDSAVAKRIIEMANEY